MAQLKDLIVTGNTRLLGKTYGEFEGKIHTNLSNDTNGITLRIPLVDGSDTAENKNMYITPGAYMYTKKGTTSTTGRTELCLGNGSAAGIDGNKDGTIRLYSQGTGSNYIANTNNHSNTYWHYLPQQSGVFAMLTDVTQNIDITGQTTTLLALTKALGTNTTHSAQGRHYARWYSYSDGGSSGISDKPTGSTNAGFVCEAICNRWCSTTDYRFTLICWVQTQNTPYIAHVDAGSTSLSWTKLINPNSYASNTTGGTLKVRLDGTTLYIRNDGTNA